MKIGQILEIEGIIFRAEQRGQNIEDKETYDKLLHLTEEQLKPFKYCFFRNKLKIKDIILEKNEILKHLQEEYNTLEVKGDYQQFLFSNEKFIEFLQEEREIDWYTIKIDSLKGEDFDERMVMNLVDILIVQ